MTVSSPRHLVFYTLDPMRNGIHMRSSSLAGLAYDSEEVACIAAEQWLTQLDFSNEDFVPAYCHDGSNISPSRYRVRARGQVTAETRPIGSGKIELVTLERRSNNPNCTEVKHATRTQGFEFRLIDTFSVVHVALVEGVEYKRAVKETAALFDWRDTHFRAHDYSDTPAIPLTSEVTVLVLRHLYTWSTAMPTAPITPEVTNRFGLLELD